MKYEVGTRVFENWEIVREIGKGAFGRVYEIQKNEYGISVSSALKVMTIPESVSDIRRALNEGMDEASVTAYYRSFVDEQIREIATMSNLKGCENIVPFEDYSIIEHHEDIGWDIHIRMELLTELSEYNLNHPMDEEAVIAMAKDILKALVYCRKKGIIHRDIKPENIFVNETGTFKLGDFGVAKTMEKTSGASKKGTESYMAPEVYMVQPYGANVDIYSLGLVLYKLMNKNRLPFYPPASQPITFTDKERALISRMKGEQMAPPVDASEVFSRIILKALEFSPNDRYKDAGEMLKSLEEIKLQNNPSDKEHERVEHVPVVEIKKVDSDKKKDISRIVENKDSIFKKKWLLFTIPVALIIAGVVIAVIVNLNSGSSDSSTEAEERVTESIVGAELNQIGGVIEAENEALRVSVADFQPVSRGYSFGFKDEYSGYQVREYMDGNAVIGTLEFSKQMYAYILDLLKMDYTLYDENHNQTLHNGYVDRLWFHKEHFALVLSDEIPVGKYTLELIVTVDEKEYIQSFDFEVTDNQILADNKSAEKRIAVIEQAGRGKDYIIDIWNEENESATTLYSNYEKHKYQGVGYDEATNTMTLDNVNYPRRVFRVCGMGDDFKIKLVGENHIKQLTVNDLWNTDWNGWGGDVWFTGDGSLAINEVREEWDPIYTKAGTNSNDTVTIRVDKTAKLNIYTRWGFVTNPSITVEQAGKVKFVLPDIEIKENQNLFISDAPYYNKMYRELTKSEIYELDCPSRKGRYGISKEGDEKYYLYEDGDRIVAKIVQYNDGSFWEALGNTTKGAKIDAVIIEGYKTLKRKCTINGVTKYYDWDWENNEVIVSDVHIVPKLDGLIFSEDYRYPNDESAQGSFWSEPGLKVSSLNGIKHYELRGDLHINN